MVCREGRQTAPRGCARPPAHVRACVRTSPRPPRPPPGTGGPNACGAGTGPGTGAPSPHPRVLLTFFKKKEVMFAPPSRRDLAPSLRDSRGTFDAQLRQSPNAPSAVWRSSSNSRGSRSLFARRLTWWRGRTHLLLPKAFCGRDVPPTHDRLVDHQPGQVLRFPRHPPARESQGS